jgi:peptidoglycan pentaglycine glycine transferase (the first glycine)
MEFQEITKDKKSQWNEFIQKNSPESFLQSFEWGEFQKATGKNVFRFVVSEDENIRLLSQVVEHKLPLGLCYWYIPRGPVIGSEISKEKKSDILEFFTDNLKATAEKSGAIFVRMDPALAKDKQEILEKLKLKLISGSVQPKDTLVIDLSKDEEQLLAGMKQKTRYNIRLAEKKGVEISFERFDEKSFEEFWKLTRETSERDGIVLHKRDYYFKMLETLSDERDSLRCRLCFARFDSKVIAANIVLYFGEYCVYLHGASSNSFRNLMAPYLLQWRQILEAKKLGCISYDFWGITLDGENPKWAGITRFKKGFGGREISYAGVYDLPVNGIVYNLYLRFRKN